MTYESWRKQVEEEDQKPREAEIGNVFLIDRGERADGTTLCSRLLLFNPHDGVCVLLQMWILSLLFAPKLSTKAL